MIKLCVFVVIVAAVSAQQDAGISVRLAELGYFQNRQNGGLGGQVDLNQQQSATFSQQNAGFTQGASFAQQGSGVRQQGASFAQQGSGVRQQGASFVQQGTGFNQGTGFSQQQGSGFRQQQQTGFSQQGAGISQQGSGAFRQGTGFAQQSSGAFRQGTGFSQQGSGVTQQGAGFSQQQNTGFSNQRVTFDQTRGTGAGFNVRNQEFETQVIRQSPQRQTSFQQLNQGSGLTQTANQRPTFSSGRAVLNERVISQVQQPTTFTSGSVGSQRFSSGTVSNNRQSQTTVRREQQDQRVFTPLVQVQQNPTQFRSGQQQQQRGQVQQQVSRTQSSFVNTGIRQQPNQVRVSSAQFSQNTRPQNVRQSSNSQRFSSQQRVTGGTAVLLAGQTAGAGSFGQTGQTFSSNSQQSGFSGINAQQSGISSTGFSSGVSLQNQGLSGQSSFRQGGVATQQVVAEETASGVFEPLNLPSGASLLLGSIDTSFECSDKPYGYYADEDNSCRVFHVCNPALYTDGRVETYHYSFMCGEGTVFDQNEMTCKADHAAIPCGDSRSYYFRNEGFGRV